MELIAIFGHIMLPIFAIFEWESNGNSTKWNMIGNIMVL